MPASINPQKQRQAGQSALEFSITLPFIFLLLAGVVEITNILVAQNRVSTSVRIATSYGTTNYRDEALPDGWSDAMAGVALHSVANTPQENPQIWDFAVVRASTDETGDSFDRWDVAFPNNTPPDTMPAMDELQAQVLDELGGGSAAAELDLMITIAHAQYDSALKLDSFFSQYPERLTAINVGLVDRQREPELVCETWVAGPAIPFKGVVDRNGSFIATSLGDESVPVQVARISGTPSFYNYLLEYRLVDGIETIKFDEAELKREDTDVIKLVLDPGLQPDLLWVSTKAGNSPQYNWVSIPMQIGTTTGSDDLGFETQIVAKETKPYGEEITLYVSGKHNNRDLSHMDFKFTSKECAQWHAPLDTGNYSGFIGTINP